MNNETLQAAVQLTKAAGFLFLIPLFPFLGAAINGIAGKKLQDRFGKRAVHAIAIGAMCASTLVALYAFVARLMPLAPHERALLDVTFRMIRVGHFQVDMAFLMDPLSGVMTLIITIVGTLIHVYSTGYMADEPSYWRFFSYLNLFVFSMLLLVLGDSFIVMFFGWEGVGLCSYLLIGFWYKERKNATAGMKAFIVNRIGDWGFVTGLFLLFWGLGGAWTSTLSTAETFEPEVKNIGASEIIGAPKPEPRTDRSFVLVSPIDEVKVPGEAEHGEAAAHAIHAPVAVPVGPTVSFRELRNQLAISDDSGARPIVEGGTLPVEIQSDRPVDSHSRVPVHFEGLANRTVWGVPLLFLACLCFFIGATGKSAQIPLYVWLPDAMAGPTPVSALIHAATMVTAGVYMVARLNFVFALSPGAMTIVAGIGALTALVAATIGLFQYDIKKVLAYSTVSQLGFMFIGVGVGAYWAGVFHLLTHAFFKACLFLGSGSVIHGMHALTHHREHALHHGAHAGDEHGAAHGHGEHKPRDPRLEADPFDPQDMRNMGGLARLMPSTRWTYLIACWAIAGFPWAAGFFSKDEILWKAWSNGSTLIPGPVIWAVGLVAATCTAFYMFRSYYLTFHFRAPSAEHEAHVHESPRSITWVLWALAGACLIVGPVLGLPSLWSGGRAEPLLEKFFEPVTQLGALSFLGARQWQVNHGLEWGFMALSVLVATAGWFAARTLYLDAARAEARLIAWKQTFAGVHKLVYEKYRVDELYQATVVRAFELLARLSAWVDTWIVDGLVNLVGRAAIAVAWIDGAIDRYVVDGAVNLVADSIILSGRELRRAQTGRINNYVLVATAGVVVIVLLVAYLV